MLEQRSEILSHYHRLDFFFFSSSHQCLFPESEHKFMLARWPPTYYSRLWFLDHTNPSNAMDGESQHYLEISSGPYPVALRFGMRGLVHAAYRESIVFEPAPQESLQLSLPLPQKGSCYLSSIPQFLASFPSSLQQGTSASPRRQFTEAGIFGL